MPSIISAGTTTGTALSLTSDTSGELQIQTNNGSTTAMTLTTTGNVGVGTTTPGAILNTSIASGANTTHFLMSETGTTSNSEILIKANNSTQNWSMGAIGFLREGGADNFALRFFTGSGPTNTERMRITSGGGVGINTSSPVAFLTVDANQAFNSEVGNLMLRNSADTTKRMYLGYDNSLNAGYIQAQQSGVNWQPLLLNPNAGNVGIGISSPTALLHVNGAARATSMSLNGVAIGDYSLYSGMVTRVSNGGGIGINSANSTDNAYIYFGSGTSSGEQQSAAIGRIGGDVLGFFTGAVQRMQIDASGNFRINAGYGSLGIAYGVRAWVNYNGTGASIRGSGNVSSVVNNGTGDNSINFATAMPDINFSWAITQQLNGTGNNDTGASSTARNLGTGSWGTGYVRILTMSNTNDSQENPLVLCVQIFR
jgi:hypothetical protein